AITHFARALGAARSGDADTARQAIDTLATLRDRTAETSAYWAKQVEIQRLSALAWLAYQEGRKEEALSTMQQAAALEAETEKHPVTPGEILPAHELLADMLLDLGRPKDALAAYEAALERSTNRFNSLYGAGHAAQQAGDKDTAADYYRRLVENAAPQAQGPQLQQARAFLAGQS
ncbi:MAG: hypothetical protein M3Z21_02825, partial [Pseudomonadota bacterium]|nr:hypothetical protein [Pseudomonadota bacterium]